MSTDVSPLYSRLNQISAEGRLASLDAAVALFEQLTRRFLDHPPRRLLDLACGGGLLTLALARSGYAARGIDLCRGGIEAAERRARREDLSASFSVDDMRAFTLPDAVDVVLCVGLNNAYLLSDDDMRRELSCVAAALSPGGLFLADFSCVDVESTFPERDGALWRRSSGRPLITSRAIFEGEVVTLSFGVPPVTYDPLSGHVSCTTRIVSKTREQEQLHEERSVTRLWSSGQVTQLIHDEPGLELLSVLEGHGPEAHSRTSNKDRFLVVARRR